MNFRLLPTLVFASLALNLFLVGVIAGGWRNLLDHTGAPPTAQVPSSEAIPDPPVPATASRPVGPPLPAATPVRAAAQAPDRVPATRPPLPAAPPPQPPPGEGPFPVEAPPREPGGNPLMRAARDLPGPERVALMTLLRSESQAVRAELHQARRERASAWRALARGEVDEDEVARRLDMARRRELAARGRVENAVADWAVRQSPDIRSRVGRALAEDAQPALRRPVRPPAGGPGWRGGPPPAGPGREEES